ncbi:MAG: RNA polymerase subunit sigma [Myxococcales bacterium]|nr:RNA polymerase subunit sigma [Myxococcales bacterium]
MDVNVANYERIVFFTGAGMSAESGVPTYRGAGGIWKEYDYLTYACQDAFDRDPSAVWDFHNYRRELVGQCQPNLGHKLIAACEKNYPAMTIVTQNIDGLHQLAGSNSVIELHGSLWRVRDERIGVRKTTRDSPFDAQQSNGSFWRPDIVWFGDMLDEAVLSDAVRVISNCDLFVSIGTSAVVYPAAQLPLLAKDAGALCIEINPEETPLSSLYDLTLRTAASTALEQLCS